MISNSNKALKIAKLLKKYYPNPKTELEYKNEMQFFVAVVLSAQTTDKKVNEITSGLFAKYKSWKDFANAGLKELQADIRGVNFHKGKADRLIKASKMIIKDFDGKLPNTLDMLIKLPGVARKSANVLLKELWYKSEGIVVDTHVTRLSNRLGLTAHKDAVKIERDLMRLIPKNYWLNISGSMVLHGRYVCKARKPNCKECGLNKLCPNKLI
jgi:endonuclease III